MDGNLVIVVCLLRVGYLLMLHVMLLMCVTGFYVLE